MDESPSGKRSPAQASPPPARSARPGESAAGPGPSFEALWLGGCAAAWLFAAYLASHRSAAPALLGRYSREYAALLGAAVAAAAAASLAAQPRWRARTARVRGHVVAALAGSALAIAGAELAVRAADPIGISYYAHAEAYHRDRVPDATRGYRHRPLLSARYGATDVAFNELGLRDAPIRPRAAGEVRIVAVGDSVTFGWGVATADSYPEQLERELGRRVGRPVNVVNGGVGGYNSTQELAFLREDGLALGPDLILLLYVTNDIERLGDPSGPGAARSPRGMPPPEALALGLGRSWLYRFARHVALYGGGSASRATGEEDPDGRRESLAAVAEMARLARAADVPMRAVFFRWSEGEAQRLLDDVRRTLAPAPVLDTAVWFAGRDPRTLVNSVADGHLNAEGNRVLARAIAEHLAATGLAADPRPAATACALR